MKKCLSFVTMIVMMLGLFSFVPHMQIHTVYAAEPQSEHTPTQAPSTADAIKVTLNGIALSFDVPPQIIEGRTMVPMRVIFESLGAEVHWDGETQTITATAEDRVIIMQVDSVVLRVHENEYAIKDIALDVPPQLVDGRTLVPVRAVAEGLLATVSWDGETQTVEIVKNNAVPPPAAPDPAPGRPLSEQPANDPVRGALYGYGNSRLRELQYVVRYIFEQDILPRAAYANEDALANILMTNDIEKIRDFVLYHWTVAVAYLVPAEEADPLLTDGVDNAEKLAELFNQTAKKYELLADQHVVEITIEDIAADTKALIIKMSEPGWVLLSTHIAIVYKDKFGLQYFTLERSFDAGGSPKYMFCFVNEGSRGTVSPIENDKEDFRDAITDEVGQWGWVLVPRAQ